MLTEIRKKMPGELSSLLLITWDATITFGRRHDDELPADDDLEAYSPKEQGKCKQQRKIPTTRLIASGAC